MLDPTGRVRTWNTGAQRIKGYAAARDHRPALLALLPARGRARGWPQYELRRPRARPLRGRRLAGAQGRHPLLGQRRHHRLCATERRTARLRQDHARPDRARAHEEEAAPERGALPPAGRQRARLRDLHARPGRQRRRAGTSAPQRIKGYSADEIIGQHFSRFYPPEDRRAGKPELELRTARPLRPRRGRRLARAQGRHAVLGQRRDHAPCTTRRRRCAASPRSRAT